MLHKRHVSYLRSFDDNSFTICIGFDTHMIPTICDGSSLLNGNKKPVTLVIIKADKALKEILLIRNSRLSVMPLTEAQFNRILELGETKA